MKTKALKPAAKAPVEISTDGRISIRLDLALARRFEAVVEASRRSKTSVIEESLEKMLPEFERQYEVAA